MNEVIDNQHTGPKNLIPAYQLDWEYPIWQLRLEAATGQVAIECRDADTLQTSFAVFAAHNGVLVLRNYKPANAWWTGLAEIRAGLLYLQGMTTKGIGRPAGITAVGATDGQVKWQRPEFSFYGLTATAILALPAAGESAELTSLNPQTGEITESGIKMAVAATQLIATQPTVQVPQHYPVDNAYFIYLKEFIYQKTGVLAHTAIDYLENEKYIALGFYPAAENQSQVYRVVLFSLSGEWLLQEDLGKELTGIGPDNFFIFQDTLILFKNKKSLLGYVV
ncbi:MAG: hypothetical protein JWQ14_1451 [Adhaeribacter sp.]|nr:hypothetical protein [Adhaeribacter sp.]